MTAQAVQMTKEFKKRWARDHASKIELIRDALAAKQQVYNRHFGFGRIVEEWGAFESERQGPNSKVVNRGKLYNRTMSSSPVNKHISGVGVFVVRFNTGEVHPINADNLTPA